MRRYTTREDGQPTMEDVMLTQLLDESESYWDKAGRLSSGMGTLGTFSYVTADELKDIKSNLDAVRTIIDGWLDAVTKAKAELARISGKQPKTTIKQP